MTDGAQDKQNIEANDNSVAVGNISIQGSITGSLTIGNTGYTAEQISALITQISTTFQPRPFDGRSPYKGLDYFEEEDAELFFGREKLVEDLIARLATSRTLFVTGPSGSGKSSLVRAGLIHALRQGKVKNSEHWLCGIMKPGREPIAELGRVTARLAKSTNAQDEICARATTDPTIFRRWCEIALADGREERVVLFLDQFEEVFTQVDRETANTLIDLLDHAVGAENGRVILLFAMRSDFVPNCATYPKLNALLNRQFVQIGAMGADELVSAIAQPALRVGLRIDPDLIAQIINDMQGEPGALPLMQFALKDLFESRQEKGGLITLTLNDYLKRGGIHKALERHADTSFNELDSDERQLARSIFTRLVEVGHGTQDTRRTAFFDELVPEGAERKNVEAVIQRLVNVRLITTDELNGKTTATISHEKLINAWAWLKKLVEENRETIKVQNEIISDSQEWEAHQRDESFLYRGSRLAQVQEKLESKQLVLSRLALEFIEIGEKAYQDEMEHLKSLTRIALARQLAAQAQLITSTQSSKQMIGILLAIQSLKLAPTAEAVQLLLNKNLAAHLITRIRYEELPHSFAFSSDGKHIVSVGDHKARVRETETGSVIAQISLQEDVTASAFSPDAKYLVTGSKDNRARIWEVATGKEIAHIDHDDPVTCAAFSPDGRYVVTGSNDHTTRIWETSTGREVAQIRNHKQVYSVFFSPNGRYAASLEQYALCICEVPKAEKWRFTRRTDKVVRVDYDSTVNSIAFSSDGMYVVSGSSDGIVRVLEAATGAEVAQMTLGTRIWCVAISPDGTCVAAGGEQKTALVWGITTGVERATLSHDDEVECIAFSPDGRFVISGSKDNTARVWEAATGKEVARMTHEDFIGYIAFHPDGQWVLSQSRDRTVRVWEAFIRGRSNRLPHYDSVQCCAFSPDGKYVVTGTGLMTFVWEVTTGRKIVSKRNYQGESWVAFSPDSRYVVSQDTYSISVWDAVTGENVAQMGQGDSGSSAAVSPDGRYIVSGSQDGTVRIWEVATGSEAAQLIHPGPINAVLFSPDGRHVAAASSGETPRVWDVASGKEIAHLGDGYDSVNALAFSQDGNLIAWGSSGNTVRVWRLGIAEEVARMAHDGLVNAVVFSPDGRYVASASHDHTARVWDVASGKEIARLTHDDFVDCVAFSSDGKYIASGGRDNAARIWKVDTGSEIARMYHEHYVKCISFSPDDRYVLSGAIIWLWQPADLIAEASAVMPRNLTRREWQRYIGTALPFQAICENLPIEPEPNAKIHSPIIEHSAW